MRKTIFAIAFFAITPAWAQEGPNPKKCPLIAESINAFNGVANEPSALTATVNHIRRMEGVRSITDTRRRNLESMIRGITWQEHRRQSLQDLAAEKTMNLCR